MAERRYTFGKQKRVRSKVEFSKVFEARVRETRGPLVVYAIPTEGKSPRLGLSVPRRVGTAPRRNRIKRLLRESFRLMQHDLPRAYDVVIVVRPHEPMILPEYQRILSAMLVKLHNAWSKVEVMQWLLIHLVLLYRVTLGRLLGGQCRFQPTCSQYAIDAIKKYGPWRGSWLAVRRIARCHPWGGRGYDPA